ncbi:MAG: ribose-5-phosphate isomerase [Bacteroidetes bacterium]|nr:MAG: ribose-5-phosphate isomerase [Bacteroidota bacterium]
MQNKTVLFATDHAGFELRDFVLPHLKSLGYEVEDMGPKKQKEGDDYPDIMGPLAQKISENPKKYVGVIMGGSGQGEAMVANKYEGVRAAVFYGGDEDIIRLSREHNDANVLSLGARFLSADQAKKAAELWLKTKFPGETRHVRRIEKIDP